MAAHDAALAKPGPAYEPLAPIDADLVNLRRIHAGRRTDVYAVWSRSRWSVLMMKELRDEYAQVERYVSALRQEGEFMVGLRHPNIAQTYEVKEHPVRLIMELIPGPTLHHRVSTGGRMSPQAALRMIMHAGSAVMYLHRRGRLHLDLKPANVITGPGLARVIDVGIARPMAEAQAEPRRGGTAKFAAPEQTQAHLGPQSAATDVFGLAATLYFALSGGPPFPSHTSFDQRDLPQLRGPESGLRESNPAISRRLEEAVLRALAPDPAERPSRMSQFLSQLEACLTGRNKVWPSGLLPD